MSQAGLTARLATVDDLASIDALGKSLHFDIGIDNLKIYFKTSPNMWEIVVNEKQEIVAYSTANEMENGIIFGFQILVRPDYLGRGLTRLMVTVHEMLKDRPFIGNAQDDSMTRWHFDSFEWQLKHYCGIMHHKLLPDVSIREDLQIVEINRHIFAQVMDYDRAIVKVDRSEFFKEYIYPGDNTFARTFVALSSPGNRVCGFGVLRQFVWYYNLSPCYADTEDIAERLMCRLAACLGVGEHINIPAPACSKAAIAFAAKMKLVCAETEQHHTTLSAQDYSRSVDLSKVVSVHEYWPV